MYQMVKQYRQHSHTPSGVFWNRVIVSQIILGSVSSTKAMPGFRKAKQFRAKKNAG